MAVELLEVDEVPRTERENADSGGGSNNNATAPKATKLVYKHDHSVQSDLYSLGCCLHWLAFGGTTPLVFEEKHTDPTTGVTTTKLRRRCALTAASSSAPGAHPQRRPKEMVQLIELLTEPDPRDRPRSCAAILESPLAVKLQISLGLIDAPTPAAATASSYSNAAGTGAAAAATPKMGSSSSSAAGSRKPTPLWAPSPTLGSNSSGTNATVGVLDIADATVVVEELDATVVAAAAAESPPKLESAQHAFTSPFDGSRSSRVEVLHSGIGAATLLADDVSQPASPWTAHAGGAQALKRVSSRVERVESSAALSSLLSLRQQQQQQQRQQQEQQPEREPVTTAAPATAPQPTQQTQQQTQQQSEPEQDAAGSSAPQTQLLLVASVSLNAVLIAGIAWITWRWRSSEAGK
jgi:hypothetical protein